MSVITRFAPSPTGFLHIGGARTALFNWLFTKSQGGKFLLRVEDTDKERSTSEAKDAILNSLQWLALDLDGDVVYQSTREARHREIAEELLRKGQAYECYCSKEEIESFRAQNPHAKFRSPWRNGEDTQKPKDISPSIRIKSPTDGVAVISDLVQGEVEVANEQLDDMIILRSDGTPTYMLAVVVDDHDMGVTHVIRGDDHLTNSFRQKLIYNAMDWDEPIFAHIPLIHGSDGAKLSKRHGALGVGEYKEMGYLPEALLSYLLRLGWGTQDDEVLEISEAIKLFDISKVGKAPSRFNVQKLNSVNSHYMKKQSPEKLWELIADKIPASTDIIKARIIKGMSGLVGRSSTLLELADIAQIYIARAKQLDAKSLEVLAEHGNLRVHLLDILGAVDAWKAEEIKVACKDFAQAKQIKFPIVMQLLRASVLGTFEAPAMFEVLEVLGIDESIDRIKESMLC